MTHILLKTKSLNIFSQDRLKQHSQMTQNALEIYRSITLDIRRLLTYLKKGFAQLLVKLQLTVRSPILITIN